MRIGINLLWVRVGICGGTESFIRNLLSGLAKEDSENEYILFVARDNADSFQSYEELNERMLLHVCNTKSMSRCWRILFENCLLNKIASDKAVDIMYNPVYSMPHNRNGNIPYVITIHDIQAIYYPQYFSFVKRLFLKSAWNYSTKNAAKIITGTNFCKEGILEHFNISNDKVIVIGDPVDTELSGMTPDTVKKYGVNAGEYFYCVSSLLEHKNLETVLKMMALRKNKNEKLVVSGVIGTKKQLNDFKNKLVTLGILDNVIITGYVDNNTRDCLYENCRLFLFPSVFEGFGMPLIEAMRKGKKVITTDRSCIREVTDGKASYVADPFEPEEWSRIVDDVLKNEDENTYPFEQYSIENVSKEYLKVFSEII